jgi:hypothetical protein
MPFLVPLTSRPPPIYGYKRLRAFAHQFPRTEERDMGDRVADDRVAVVVDNWFPRFLANGLDYLDVRRTLDAVGSWADWADARAASADRYETLAAEAESAGHLREPLCGGAAGLVLLVPGLESTKEQFSTLEPYLLDRGLATLSIEGQGQGEMRYHRAFRDPDYAAATLRIEPEGNHSCNNLHTIVRPSVADRLRVSILEAACA